jgi:transcriptional regulator with XRE-family HTH domain
MRNRLAHGTTVGTPAVVRIIKIPIEKFRVVFRAGDWVSPVAVAAVLGAVAELDGFMERAKRSRFVGWPELVWLARNVSHICYTHDIITGRLIREARLRAGLKQSELARAVGTTQSAVARWESDDATPNFERLREIVRACGLEIGYGLYRRDDETVKVVRDGLSMTPAQRVDDLLDRIAEEDNIRRTVKLRPGGSREVSWWANVVRQRETAGAGSSRPERTRSPLPTWRRSFLRERCWKYSSATAWSTWWLAGSFGPRTARPCGLPLAYDVGSSRHFSW